MFRAHERTPRPFPVACLIVLLIFVAAPQARAEDEPSKIAIDVPEKGNLIHNLVSSKLPSLINKVKTGEEPPAPDTIKYNRGIDGEIPHPQPLCTAAVLGQALIALDGHTIKEAKWNTFKFGVELIPYAKAGKGVKWTVKTLIAWADSESPEQFAENVGKNVVEDLAGARDSTDAAYKVAKKAYQELMKDLEKELKNELKGKVDNGHCGYVYFTINYLYDRESGAIQLLVDLYGDCQCKTVKMRYGQEIELKDWKLRITVDMKIAPHGEDESRLTLRPVKYSYYFNKANCDCDEPEDSSTAPPVEDQVEESVVIDPEELCHPECRSEYWNWQFAKRDVSILEGYIEQKMAEADKRLRWADTYEERGDTFSAKGFREMAREFIDNANELRKKLSPAIAKEKR